MTALRVAPVLLLAACSAAPAPPQEVLVAAWSGEWDASLGTATVKGRVKLDGKRPERRTIDMKQEAHCAKLHAESPALDESAVVAEDGAVQNVFVYVKDGLEAWKFPAPAEAVVVDQVGCTYVPHVVGMQLGQVLKFRNSDPILHNVHGMPKRNEEFNEGQPKQDSETEIAIRRAEIMIPVKCEVHAWMSAYVGVVKHPYFRVTGADGAFALANLPPGKFVLEAWHETFGTLTQEVDLGDKESKEVVFTFPAR